MNNKETTEIRKLVGIVDLRWHGVSNNKELQACFRYEIREIKPLGGGAIRIMDDPRYEDEWKTVSDSGCIASDYKIT